jgi:hypothetical protein
MMGWKILKGFPQLMLVAMIALCVAVCGLLALVTRVDGSRFRALGRYRFNIFCVFVLSILPTSVVVADRAGRSRSQI